MLIALLGLAASACSDDKDEVITSDKLPASARTFVSQYYPAANIVFAQKDKDEYEAVLSDDTRIEFNKQGDWSDVDAPVGQAVAKGFYPEAIDTYVEANYPGAAINEISKERRGYDVDLTSDIDLIFSSDGTFLALD